MTIRFRLLLLACFFLFGLIPCAVQAQTNVPVRVLVHHFSHQIYPDQVSQFPDYFAYDPAWTWALQQQFDLILRTRFSAT